MRKLFVLAAVMVAALAFGATGAFAETEAPVNPTIVPDALERDDATGGPCPAVSVGVNHEVTGGCTIEALGEAHMVGHTIFGETTAARCENHFEGHVDADGHGYIGEADVIIRDGEEVAPVDCEPPDGVRACNEMEAAELGTGHGENWEVQAYEEPNGGYWMNAAPCLANTVVGTVAGDLWIRVILDGDNEVVRFEAEGTEEPNDGHRLRNREGGIGDAEFDGDWDVVNSGSLGSMTHTGIEVMD
jgi:hypothetical protein